MTTKHRPYLFLLLLNLIPLSGLGVITYFHLPPFGLAIYGPYFTLITASFAVYAWRNGYTLEELGFTGGNQRRSILISLGVTLAFCLLISSFFVYNPFQHYRTLQVPTWDWYYVRYVLLFCPFQEVIYRSLVFARLRREGITGMWPLILLTAITFSFVHILFLNAFTLFLTLVIGLVWGYMYYKQKSFWAVALSHGILGALTIAIGLL
ncbi:MAG: CPBP family intramembrane glutamic endopeptidase [bacterium]